MPIRALTPDDTQTWLELAHESDDIIEKLIRDTAIFYNGFDEYIQRKIKQKEAFMAVDRKSSGCLGIVAFSKNHNRISFLGTTEAADFKKTGSELAEFALNKLDNSKEVTATVLKSDAETIKQERKLYELFNFAECDDTIFEAGIQAYLMKRPPTRTDKRTI